MESFLSQLFTFTIGGGVGSFLFLLVQNYRGRSFEEIAAHIVSQAEKVASIKLEKAEQAAEKLQLSHAKTLEDERQIFLKKVTREEDRLNEREAQLAKRMEFFEKKIHEIDIKEKQLTAEQELVARERAFVTAQKQQLSRSLETAAMLTGDEARALLLDQLQKEMQNESASLIQQMIQAAEANAEKQAQKILTSAVNRLNTSTLSEATVHTIPLPSEHLKARIIGKEGRNIRSLERLTGITFLVDDTPGAIVLSGFDPIRLQVAHTTLSELLIDGRIHPTSIEEAVKRAQKTVSKQIEQYGYNAAMAIGAVDMHPELKSVLGKLKFRHSFGQNILDHSLEVAHLMGLIAAELQLDVPLAKRIGLLHDIGKAVSHEIEGPHALVGYSLALKYGESIQVANGIGCHHNEMAPQSMEASLCATADAISGSRPGARTGAIEDYIKRMERLEEIAYHFPGIEEAYALQSGREIRVIVRPDMIDDAGAVHLARDLAKKIEKEMRYPGRIKVTIIREKKVTDYATTK